MHAFKTSYDEYKLLLTYSACRIKSSELKQCWLMSFFFFIVGCTGLFFFFFLNNHAFCFAEALFFTEVLAKGHFKLLIHYYLTWLCSPLGCTENSTHSDKSYIFVTESWRNNRRKWGFSPPLLNLVWSFPPLGHKLECMCGCHRKPFMWIVNIFYCSFSWTEIPHLHASQQKV